MQILTTDMYLLEDKMHHMFMKWNEGEHIYVKCIAKKLTIFKIPHNTFLFGCPDVQLMTDWVTK